MRRRILIILILILTILMNGCTESKMVEPDSPTNTAWLMKLTLDNRDYERFNEFFSEGRKNTISKEIFSQLSNVTTTGADYTTFELVTFQNGEMVLVQVTPNLNGKVYIEDVFIIPEEMKPFFKAKID